jgi:starch phosphorylase
MKSSRIAYFSMEIALDPGMPTYSGGLGVLAGDMIRSAADIGLPMVAVSLIHRKGYFFQHLSTEGWQTEEPAVWSIDDYATLLPASVTMTLEGKLVTLRAWEYLVKGTAGSTVSVFLLDADVEGNAPEHRRLTDSLYGGDERYRLCQEAILGIGGVRFLRALGLSSIERFHMNEGHSSLLAIELLNETRRAAPDITPEEAIQKVRERVVFTTHTPVPAGHDRFPSDLVRSTIGDECSSEALAGFHCKEELNMTALALGASHYVNGVAKRHGEVSRKMFPMYSIDWITNGVHPATWVCPAMADLFDEFVPGWRADPHSLRSALSIPSERLRSAHRQAKRGLLDRVNRECNSGMDVDFLTIGFARRATAYKRPDLIFNELAGLSEIDAGGRPIQLVFAGKAHPKDVEGKRLIQRIVQARASSNVKICYLPNYDMVLAKHLVAGVDVWLNTPHPPFEASGTSGMKAALNGVPSLSVLDGWWIEGCIESVTGWAIGNVKDDEASVRAHGARLLEKLRDDIVPMFYERQGDFTEVMAGAIGLNGAFFNTHRMLQQYVSKAYYD